jgi:ribonuclease HI
LSQTTNLITVFSDASWRDGAAGYAFWSRNNTMWFNGYHPINWPVATNVEAECIALCEAIVLSLDALPHQAGVIIVAQSDSVQALGLMKSFGGYVSKGTDCPIANHQGTKTARDFAKNTQLRIHQSWGQLWLKHVKGHQGKGSGDRAGANIWCDRHATIARKEAEQHLQLIAKNA